MFVETSIFFMSNFLDKEVSGNIYFTSSKQYIFTFTFNFDVAQGYYSILMAKSYFKSVQRFENLFNGNKQTIDSVYFLIQLYLSEPRKRYISAFTFLLIGLYRYTVAVTSVYPTFLRKI